MRLTYPDGRLAHAELRRGPATVMLSDEHPEYGLFSPLTHGGTGAGIHLHVDDVARLTAKLRDPFGHEWLLGHQLEALSPEEIQQRFATEFQGEKPD